MQLDQGEKGFSFSKEGPLDMRMDPTLKTTAKDIVNRWTEKELGNLFREFGEEPRWRKAAKAIVDKRRQKPIQTTKQLADIITDALKTKTRGRLHPATLIFQALRICVNHEMEAIEKGITQALKLLSPQGRLGTIAFHRLEDRMVKHLLKAAVASKEFGLVNKKPLVPTYAEIRLNKRSRSAKMRFVEKLFS